ncbi:MAG: hypothetical protein KAQ75_05195, partial [Bacteroidales bacterium]|nr:hypothetical protein [Bacteroidales bacterium]
MLLKIKSYLFFIFFLIVVGCVPTKQFEDLQQKNDTCQDDLEITKGENKNLIVENTELNSRVDIMGNRLKDLREDSLEREAKLHSIDIKYDKLNRQYGDLQQAQDQLLSGNITETKKLL